MCCVLFYQTLKWAPQMKFALVMCTITKYERWYCARHLHLNVLIHFFYTMCTLNVFLLHPNCVLCMHMCT